MDTVSPDDRAHADPLAVCEFSLHPITVVDENREAVANVEDFFDIVQGVSGELTSESCESEGFDPKKPLSQQS